MQDQIEEYKLVELQRYYAVAEANANLHNADRLGVNAELPVGVEARQYYYHPGKDRLIHLGVECVTTGQAKKRGGWVDVYENKGFVRMEGDELMDCIKERQAKVYHAYGMRAPWESEDPSGKAKRK